MSANGYSADELRNIAQLLKGLDETGVGAGHLFISGPVVVRHEAEPEASDYGRFVMDEAGLWSFYPRDGGPLTDDDVRWEREEGQA